MLYKTLVAGLALSVNGLTVPARAPAPTMQMAPAVGETVRGVVAPTAAAVDSAILVQGGSLRTWSYRSPSVEQVQVVLSTEGRPSMPTSSSGTARTTRLARCACTARTARSARSAP